MTDKLLIGIDFGTDSVRAVLHDLYGKELATAVRNYPRWEKGLFCNPIASQFRQHPLDYLECLEEVLKDILQGQDAQAVIGIGLDTTGSTPCPVNAHGTPLAMLPEFADDPNAMFILWKDHTSQAEADQINRVAQAWADKFGTDFRRFGGGIYSCEWFWSKLLHILRTSPKIREAACSWVEHCDWMVAELIGCDSHRDIPRSRCAAGHKALWNAAWGGLPPQDFLSAIDPLLDGIRNKLYIDTVTANSPAGHLSPKWAAKLGLSTNVVVACSAIDCHVGAVGAQIQAGQMIMVMGTSTCNLMTAPQDAPCVKGICGQVDGSVIPGLVGMEAGQSAFGDVYAWFRRLISWGAPVTLEKLENEAASVPPGANGILSLDWFNGRRTPDTDTSRTGAIVGLNLGATPPMIYRSLVESTAFGTRAIMERFISEGIPVESIAALGGITRKSPLVMQICADVLQRPIHVVACDQACALGAAMFAAVAAGIYPDIMQAMDAMGRGYDGKFIPNPSMKETYDHLFSEYISLGKRLQ